MTDLQIDLCINSCWPQAMFPLIYEILQSCWTVQFFCVFVEHATVED